MKNSITPFLWFDGKAEEAAKLYSSLFSNSKVISMKHWAEGSPFPKEQIMTCVFELHGQRFHAFDAGPLFKFNATISFFVVCETESEINKLWEGLIHDGKVMMALDKYPWSEKYGWIQDRFGISWQLMMGDVKKMGQKIIPAFMFTGSQAGKAEQAIELYTKVFANSSIKDINRYATGEGDIEGTIKHGRFTLSNQNFIAMDSSYMHGIEFNEAISLFIPCDTQEEIDYYWNKLSEGGQIQQCAWLKDKFGLSWQIVPTILPKLLGDPDRAKANRVMQAMLQMKKFDIAKLQQAAKG